jgi:hypothetical protein
MLILHGSIYERIKKAATQETNITYTSGERLIKIFKLYFLRLRWEIVTL